jgi:hypothetical protein
MPRVVVADAAIRLFEEFDDKFVFLSSPLAAPARRRAYGSRVEECLQISRIDSPARFSLPKPDICGPECTASNQCNYTVRAQGDRFGNFLDAE